MKYILQLFHIKHNSHDFAALELKLVFWAHSFSVLFHGTWAVSCELLAFPEQSIQAGLI
jgi:hypothetical protein